MRYMRYKKLILLILILFIVEFRFTAAAQDKINFESNLNKWDNINIKIKIDEDLFNITYKKVGEKELKLDIYYPFFSIEKNYPVIIFVHGGGFVIGEKNDINRFNSVFQAMLREGWAVVSVDYRLLKRDILFPVSVEDVKDAVWWVVENADIYEFDTDKIGLWGTSAGGNLALLTALTYRNEQSNKDNIIENNYENDSLIDFVLAISSPTNLLAEDFDIHKRLVRFYVGNNTSTEILEKASPIYYLNNNNIPPILLAHGSLDLIVPYSQSESFYMKLKEINKECKLITLSGGHTLNPIFLSDLGEHKEEIISFIKKQFDK